MNEISVASIWGEPKTPPKKEHTESWQRDWPPLPLVLLLPHTGRAKLFCSGLSCYRKNGNELLDQPNTNSSVMLTKQSWFLPSSFSFSLSLLLLPYYLYDFYSFNKYVLNDDSKLDTLAETGNTAYLEKQ